MNYDQPHARYGICIVDPLGGHGTIVAWYDDLAAAQRIIVETYNGQATIVTASGIIGSARNGATRQFRASGG